MGEPGRFRIDAPCVGMQVAQIGQTHAVRDGNKKDRILVRYSSVRYSHRLGYAQPSRGSLWLWGRALELQGLDVFLAAAPSRPAWSAPASGQVMRNKALSRGRC